ncbi:MAG: site-2 protease family protein [Thainema sp.]
MNGLRFGNLFGIPFYINPSWFLVLALVTWDYGGGLAQQFPTLTGAAPWLLGLGAALLLFASVLAHELGHSFVAIRQGINVKSITLFIFGGLASLERESDSPAEAFWVAIAGPLVSFMLFFLFMAISILAPISGPIAAIVNLLAYINLAIGLFNLIPGLPLDGGNVLKSLVWKITGNSYKGMTFAGRVGQFIGWSAIGLSVLSFFGLSPIGSVWTLLIGWFLLRNAGFAAQSAQFQERLDGLTAGDVVEPDSPVIAATASLRQFADESILNQNSGWQRFLVTDDDQQLMGTASIEDLKQIPIDQWETQTVRDIAKRTESELTIQSNRPLLDVIQLLEEKRLSALTVITENGNVVGLLEKSAIIDRLRNPNQLKSV